MSIPEAAQQFQDYSAAGRNSIFIWALALIFTGLGFWNWRGAVKAALVLILFEGVLRKQLLPAAQELNYALKDFLLAGAYLRFFLLPDEAVRRTQLAIGKHARLLALTAICVVSLGVLNPNLGSPWTACFGLLIYLFYMPLWVMMPRLFSSEADMKKGLLGYALCAAPICCTCIYQWWTPSASILSPYASGLGSPPRITGTFSYVSGLTAFLSLFFGLHLGLLSCSQPAWARWVLLLNLALLITCGALSESRTAMTQMVLWGVLLTIYMVLRNGVRRIWLIGALGLLVILAEAGLATNQWGLHHSYVASTARAWTRGAESVMHTVFATPLSGYGIAASHPRMESLRRHLRAPKPPKAAPVYDSEPFTIYSELGPAGFAAWYLLRLTLLILSIQSVRAGMNREIKPLGFVFVLAQLFSLFVPFVLNAVTALLVTAASGLTIQVERGKASKNDKPLLAC